MNLRALFVDLGGVLVVNRVREVGERYEKSGGLTPEMTKKVFRYIQTSKHTEKELNEYLKNENINPEIWKKFTLEFYSSEARNDDLVDLLFQLKTKGILIVFTTNNVDISKGIQKYKLENIADLIINSSEYGVAKPDKEFWETAYSEAKKHVPDLKREEILVIDDSKTNCLSAEQLGFRYFQYVNSPESQEKIREMLS